MLLVSSRLRGPARARGVLMVKTLNKCILSILVNKLCYRQTAQYFFCLQKIEIQMFKNTHLIGRKKIC